MNTKLTLGFSPCPNDTFIFDAMIHGKIDTEGFDFDVTMADVEDLNQKAFNSTLDITKLSYHAYAYLTDNYVLLDSGSALGNNCGPLLISKRKITNPEQEINTVAIPGKYTTANFLLGLYAPYLKDKKEVLFSDIEKEVLDEKVDAGLIIHENRFTYHKRGLHKIVDLGEFWEQLTHAPIPLGGIVIKRNLPEETKKAVNRIIRKSIEFAFKNPSSSKVFIKANAQEMSEDVMQKHIDLYVNKYSVDLGIEGKKAIKTLFDKAESSRIIPKITNNIFLNN
jgi:1,4-dihydroxy-6-naphthoate synthase